jgi:hypothetical protein
MITAAPVHSTGLMRLITICQTGSRLTRRCRAGGESGCPVVGSGGIAVMVVSSPRIGFHG